jgi:hypothetical protein
VGDIPYVRVKLLVKEPTLDSPTAMQISATDRSVPRSSAAARSSRRVSRYACGDTPNARRNCSLKWARDNPAALARSATVSRSKYRASARSLARSRCRDGATEATPEVFQAGGTGTGCSDSKQA